METVHRLLELTREQVGQAGFGVLQNREDPPLVIPGWPAKNIVDDLFPITRMVDTNA